jgi:molybdopterin/thiamine biosynthesis adenylyltransferase
MVDDTRIVAHFPAKELVKHRNVYIIGVGGGGSFLVDCLLRLNWPADQIIVFDDDVVEEHNITNQLYLPHHIGMKKTEALAERTAYMGNIKYESIKVEKDFLDLDGFVICQTDTFKSRYEIFTEQIQGNKNVELFIDSRVGAINSRVYCINPNNDKHARKYLQSIPAELDEDDGTESTLCGTTVSIQAMLVNTASIVALTLQEYLRNEAEMNDPKLEIPTQRLITPSTSDVMSTYW